MLLLQQFLFSILQHQSPNSVIHINAYSCTPTCKYDQRQTFLQVYKLEAEYQMPHKYFIGLDLFWGLCYERRWELYPVLSLLTSIYCRVWGIYFYDFISHERPRNMFIYMHELEHLPFWVNNASKNKNEPELETSHLDFNKCRRKLPVWGMIKSVLLCYFQNCQVFAIKFPGVSLCGHTEVELTQQLFW